MEKINFKDLPSTETPINSSNLNLLQDNVENEINNMQQCLTIGLSQDVTLTSTTTYQQILIPLNVEYCKVGEKLKLENNKIIIPSGVSKVLVSSNMLSQGNTSSMGLYIRKNGTRIANTYTVPTTASLFGVTLTNKLIDVQENDEIDLILYLEGSNISKTIKAYDGGGTYLTVQVVK